MQIVFLDKRESYDLILYNPSDADISFELAMWLNGAIFHKMSNFVRATNHKNLFTVYSGFINDHAKIEINCREHFTSGHGDDFILSKKISPKAFFKAQGYFEPLQQKAHIFALNKMVHTELPSPPHIDAEPPCSDLVEIPTYDPEYNVVIDLHIEALNPPRQVPNLLDFQMKEFKKWLRQGIIIGHSPLTVIHGIGEGVLRTKIHEHLKNHPQIKSFRNDYTPQYGFGATVIYIK